MAFIFAVISGYIFGCFNAAYYLMRWWGGNDIRTLHTGTAGATNIGRVWGKKFFVLALLLDALKGALAVSLNCALADGETDFYGAIALLFCVLGHLYPVQLHWRGGKGLATTWGGMWLLSPPITLLMSIFALLMKFFPSELRGQLIITAYFLLLLFSPATWFSEPAIRWLCGGIVLLLWTREVE